MGKSLKNVNLQAMSTVLCESVRLVFVFSIDLCTEPPVSGVEE